MTRHINLGDSCIDSFPVYEADNYTKKSGETVFTARFWCDGVVAAPTYTIAEIGTSGEYKLTFLPTLTGFWLAEVLVNYNKETWKTEAEVEPIDAQFGLTGADDALNLVIGIWAEHGGRRLTDVTSIAAVIRTTAGVLVVNLGTCILPTAQGLFAFTTPASGIVQETAYILDLTMIRNGVTCYANVGFAKA